MTESVNPEPPQKDLRSTNKIKVVGLIALVAVISSILTGLSVFAYFKYTGKESVSKVSQTNISNESSNFTYNGISAEVEKIFQEIFTGEVNYVEKNNNVFYFAKSFDLTEEGKGYLTLNITTYKYFQGAKITEGYEGASYITNLDTIIENLSKYRLGKQIGVPIDAKSVLPGNYEIIYKELGKNKYAIYDTTFLGGGIFRHYFSYNKETSQILHLVLSTDFIKPKPEGEQECYDSEGKTCVVVYKYPEELKTVIGDIENLLSRY